MSNYTLIPFSDDWSDAWDKFVISRSRNGTIFHERNFLEYHAPDRFRDASVLFIRQGSNPPVIDGVFTAALLPDGALVSHPGSSYGGLVFARTCTLREILEMVEGLVAHAGSCGAKSVEMRLPESLIFSDPPDQELSYLLWHRGFQLKTRELSSVIPLKTLDHRELAKSTYSWAVRRGEKAGLTISTDISIERIYPLILDNLQKRYKKAPAHSLAELVDLKKRYPERIKAWTALLANEPVASVVVFETNAKTVHDFYIAQLYGETKLQPLYFIFDRLLAYYKQQGVTYFNFGISSREQWIKWGILDFKEGLGGRAVFRETWFLPDVTRYVPYAE